MHDFSSSYFSQSAAHGGQQCNKFMAYALSHKGKATSSVSYNAEDGPEAYSNPSIYTRLNEYTSMAREVHGPEYDPTQEKLSWRSEEERSMDGTGFATARSTPLLLRLYLR
jgi:hypothetical protein